MRVVVAIDPAVSSGEDSDETGIIVAGKDKNSKGYVLADLSGRYTPIEWARIAVAAYKNHGADRIVAEVNNGGDLVEAQMRVVDDNVAYTAVHATRGKMVRAEPVSALYEQGRIRHMGAFPMLEDQMCEFVPDLDRSKPKRDRSDPSSLGMGGGVHSSPDRADALVWAFTELLVEEIASWGIYETTRRKAEAVIKARLAPGVEAAGGVGPLDLAKNRVWVVRSPRRRAADGWNYLHSWLIAVSIPGNATRIPSRSLSSQRRLSSAASSVVSD
jgi:hypothetical protein